MPNGDDLDQTKAAPNSRGLIRKVYGNKVSLHSLFSTKKPGSKAGLLSETGLCLG